MKKLLILSVTFLLLTNKVSPQGCIIVRNISGFGQYNLTDKGFSTSNWQLNITNRYFKSHRDFKGTINQNTPDSDVHIIYSYTLDLSITRMLSKGWSLGFSLPIASNTRSATVEHGGAGTPRHSTHSFGIGDIRITAYKWLVNPSVKQNWNLQIGLGLKFPTGDYRYEDYFYRNDSTKVLAPVSPSIQLGDGGTGIITELNTFYVFNSRRISLYGNFYYLVNPREQNGVSTTFGKIPTPLQVKTGGNVNSVPDQYSIRAGIDFNFKRLLFSAGLRHEGTPVYDLIGGSNGYRRAGYNLSVEPGILYKMKKGSVYAYIPIIVSRNIKQTVPDKKESEITNEYVVKMGGSPNYLLFVGASFKL